MAEEEKQEAEGAEGEGQEGSEGKKKSKLMLIVGGVAGVLALAYVAMLMAVPSISSSPGFGTRFPIYWPLDEDEKFNVNIQDNGMKRFIRLRVVFEVRAYEESYCSRRQADPLYHPYMKSAFISVCAGKFAPDIYPTGQQPAFFEEIRVAAEPVLFPIHVGETKTPNDIDSDSGLQPGLMSHMASFRGRFYEHFLHVDAKAKTIQLDDGEPVTFVGDEVSLTVKSADSRTISLNVTDLDPEFVGDVRVGVHGQIMRVLATDFILQ